MVSCHWFAFSRFFPDVSWVASRAKLFEFHICAGLAEGVGADTVAIRLRVSTFVSCSFLFQLHTEPMVGCYTQGCLRAHVQMLLPESSPPLAAHRDFAACLRLARLHIVHVWFLWLVSQYFCRFCRSFWPLQLQATHFHIDHGQPPIRSTLSQLLGFESRLRSAVLLPALFTEGSVTFGQSKQMLLVDMAGLS